MYHEESILEGLRVQEVAAWDEYLDICRTSESPLNEYVYEEVEPWAWDRLSSQLQRISKRVRRLERSTA